MVKTFVNAKIYGAFPRDEQQPYLYLSIQTNFNKSQSNNKLVDEFFTVLQTIKHEKP